MDWLTSELLNAHLGTFFTGFFTVTGTGIALWAGSRNSKRQLAHSRLHWSLDFDEQLAQSLREKYPDLVSASFRLIDASTSIYAAAEVTLDESGQYDPVRIADMRSVALTDFRAAVKESYRIIHDMDALSTDAFVDEQILVINLLAGLCVSEVNGERYCRQLGKTDEWVRETTLKSASQDFHKAVTNLPAIIKARLNKPHTNEKPQWFRLRRLLRQGPDPTEPPVIHTKVVRTSKWDRYREESLKGSLERDDAIE